jgi:hypothetical protein
VEGNARLGEGARLNTEFDDVVLIEILARRDCPSRGMALAVVERVVAETGVPARIEIVDMTTELQAQRYHFLGSPTVRIDGRDVDPRRNTTGGYTLADRVYRTENGLSGWPDERWVRHALLLAVAQSTSNGDSY